MTVNKVAEVSAQYMAELDANAVPAGYKQTEVGVIPEDWEVNLLSDGVALVSGHHVMAQYCNTDGKGTPYLTGPADFPNGQIIVSKYTEKPTSMCTKGDLLITVKGSGAGSLVEADSAYCISRQLMAIQSRLWDSRFLTFSILQNAESIKSAAAGLIPGLSRADILEQTLPIPPVEEQTAIANALSDVDALISELEKLIAKKQAIKTATMQQLLTGRTRLPQFALREDGSKKGYKQSELGEIPEDWECMKLGEIGQTVIGLTYSPNDVAEYGTLVLRSSNVQNGRLAYADNVYVNMDLPERVIVKEGDILICVRNGSRQLIGKCALIDKRAEGSAFGAFMSIFRTKSSAFVFYQFQSDIVQTQIGEIMGATINQITNKDMSEFIISIPNEENEQTAISSILSDIDSEIQALQQRLTKTRQIKQGMMQELLTGRIRLLHDLC